MLKDYQYTAWLARKIKPFTRREGTEIVSKDTKVDYYYYYEISLDAIVL